jgi:hypothetical protein
MNRRWFAASLLLVVMMTFFTAQACGPDFYPDVFVRKLRPDHPKQYAAGKLGVMLPTYPRADLAVAFRYLNGGSLSAAEQKAYQPTDSYYDIQEFERDYSGHANEVKEVDPADQWAAARAKFAAREPKVEKDATTDVKQPNGTTFHNDYSNCLGGAFDTAVETLQSRAKTWGERSPDLIDWLKGQDAVFANCTAQTLILPSAAPPGSSALLKADRAYQIAAAEFYGGKYEDARVAFEAVGQDTTSPWQGLARYLAARCLVREAFAAGVGNNSDQMADFDRDMMQQAVALLEALLKEKPQGISRDAILNLRDLAQLRSDPNAQLHLLSTALAGPKTDPRYTTHLRDLTWYLNIKLDQLPVREDADDVEFDADSSRGAIFLSNAQKAPIFSKTYHDLASFRSSALLIDWLITFQSPASEAKAHALAEWKKTHQLYWLLAAITKATGKDAEAADLVIASEAIKADSPAWESITYHRLRLLIALGRAQEARTLLDQTLPRVRAGGRDSSLSLYLGLRMRASTNLNEALTYAPRKILVQASESQSALGECLYVMKDPKRVYDCKKEDNPLQFSDDAASFFNAQAPLSTLVEAAQSDALPLQLRRSVAMMAWVRCVLLQDDAAAARLFPLLPEKLQQQAGSGTGFHPLMTLLRNPGLRPYLDAGVQRSYSYDFVESYRDNWWAPSWEAPYTDYKTPIEMKPVAFLTPIQQADEKREISALLKQGGACVNLGERTLAYASSHPTDPDVPESLYLVLRMIRYSGMDYSLNDPPAVQEQARNKVLAIQKSAARLLRQRYASSPWTKRAAPIAE